jgi:hypothetical protein
VQFRVPENIRAQAEQRAAAEGKSLRLGMAPPPAGRLAGEVAGGPGTGPAGWSAALALGLSTQVPRRESIAVPGRAPRNPGTIRIVSRHPPGAGPARAVPPARLARSRMTVSPCPPPAPASTPPPAAEPFSAHLDGCVFCTVRTVRSGAKRTVTVAAAPGA